MFKQRPYIPIALMVGAWVLIAVVAWQLSGSRSTEAASVRSDQPVAATYRGTLPVAHFDVSPPLRDMKVIPPGPGKLRENEDRERERQGPNLAQPPDPVVQRLLGGLSPFVMPTPIISFDGPNNTCNCSPPDPNGEVGPNHYVVMTNLSFQIYNKTGTSLFGPAQNKTLWAGFGGACQNENAGDPVVLYDQLADRWLLSQFTAAGPTYYNCVALSQTADPTGSYYRWAFTTGTNFPDYPKYGMFPDAYYISTREFAGNPFAGVGAYAANRAQMLVGNPNPTVISFLAPPSPAYNVGDGLLPADLDGTTLPPAGNPAYYVGSMDDNGPYGAPQDALTLWKFTVDFATPPASSFVLANTIPTAAFNTNFPPCGGGRNCIPQPGTANRIDMLASRQRPLFRLAYRNMGSYESLVSNISVNAGTGPTGDTAGIRWFELRSPNSSPTIFQQGTYAPGLTDGIHRWMGSIAMDTQGNMALGYSASSTTLFPSIRYTGRLVGDPLGTMPQGEASIIEGTGSQTVSQRWGDYSDMTVDPVDDCTFWYVHEYIPVSSNNGWRIRIGSFKFPQCAQGTPTPTETSTPPPASPTQTPNPATNTPTATVTPTICPVQFVDVPVGSTFYDYVRCLACRGIVGGYPCGGPGEPCPGNYYRPNNNVTRGQVSKIVSESAGFTDPVPSTQQTFEDVAPGSTFALWVERLSTRGIIGGYPCGGPFEPCVAPTNRPYFRPNNNVTRGQLSKITSGAAGWTETPTGQTFEDVAVGSTFYLYIERMASRGIISGYPCGGPFEPCVAPTNRPYFRPNNNATRGQMSKIAASAFFPNCSTPAVRR